jgi:basic amino acid/polyamine antiporter, APA family
LAEPDRPSLERTITVGGSALLSFNGAVGAAIFALPASLLVDWGTFSPWLFLIVAVAALLVIIPFTRSAAAFTDSGGPATYGLVFGRLAGFELGWIYYVAKAAGFAANLNVLADYLSRWWVGAADGVTRVGTILTAWVLLVVINLFGMKRALACLTGCTVLKALPLVAVAIAALVMFGPPPAPALADRTASVEAGFLVIFYAFVGFENAVVPTGETQDPRTTLPRAVGLTILATALLYFLVQLAFVTASTGASTRSNAPMIDLGRLVAGQFGAVALTLAAIFSLLGNLLGGSASTPRVTYAMGIRGDLPTWFGRVSRTRNSPANSILFLGAVVAVMAISGSFVWLAVVSTLARLLLYPITIAALPFAPNRPPLKAMHWISGAAGIAICLWGMTQANAGAWVTLLGLGVGGVFLFGIAALGRGLRQAPASI